MPRSVADDPAMQMLDMFFWPLHAMKAWSAMVNLVTDALSVVLDKLMRELDLSPADQKRLADFTDLADSIEEIKAQEAMKRIQRMAAELSNLKKTQPALYTRAVEVLERVLRKPG